MKTQALFIIPPTLTRQIDEVDLTLASGSNNLVLDFSGCSFISVEGLEWLEELLMRAESLQSKVEIKDVAPSIYKVFKVARIDSILRACGGTATVGPAC